MMNFRLRKKIYFYRSISHFAFNKFILHSNFTFTQYRDYVKLSQENLNGTTNIQVKKNNENIQVKNAKDIDILLVKREFYKIKFLKLILLYL